MTMVAATPSLFVPADSGFRDSDKDAAAKRSRLRRGAIIAAALLHAAIIAAILVQWPFVFTPPEPEKEPITVALVVEPPPPAPPPQAKPEPTPPEAFERHSGPNQETTAPQQADIKGPAAAPKPQPQVEPDQGEVPVPAKPKPSPPVAMLPTPRPRDAERETAPEPVTRSAVHVVIGELKEGDPYLNTLEALIERHRFYPRDAVGAFGKQLEGIAVFRFALSSAGALEGIQLEVSSGSDSLDEAARAMIKASAPFPPPPSYVHADAMVLEWKIRVFQAGQ